MDSLRVHWFENDGKCCFNFRPALTHLKSHFRTLNLHINTLSWRLKLVFFLVFHSTVAESLMNCWGSNFICENMFSFPLLFSFQKLKRPFEDWRSRGVHSQPPFGIDCPAVLHVLLYEMKEMENKFFLKKKVWGKFVIQKFILELKLKRLKKKGEKEPLHQLLFEIKKV